MIIALPAAPGLTVALALVEPAGTVTFADTATTLVLLLTRLMTWPFGPAGDDKVTSIVPGTLLLKVSGFGPSVIGTLITLTVAVPVV